MRITYFVFGYFPFCFADFSSLALSSEEAFVLTRLVAQAPLLLTFSAGLDAVSDLLIWLSPWSSPLFTLPVRCSVKSIKTLISRTLQEQSLASNHSLPHQCSKLKFIPIYVALIKKHFMMEFSNFDASVSLTQILLRALFLRTTWHLWEKNVIKNFNGKFSTVP